MKSVTASGESLRTVIRYEMSPPGEAVAVLP